MKKRKSVLKKEIPHQESSSIDEESFLPHSIITLSPSNHIIPRRGRVVQQVFLFFQDIMRAGKEEEEEEEEEEEDGVDWKKKKKKKFDQSTGAKKKDLEGQNSKSPQKIRIEEEFYLKEKEEKKKKEEEEEMEGGVRKKSTR
jgi:hypothetical protein